MKLNIFNVRKMLAGLVCAVGFFSSFSGQAQQRTLYRPADSVSLGGKSLTAVLAVPTGGSGGTGLTGILKPLAGKTISCSFNNWQHGWVSGYAMVDANGNPYTRMTMQYGDWFHSYDSGWVAGTTAGGTNWDVFRMSTSTGDSGIGGDVWYCSVGWPLN